MQATSFRCIICLPACLPALAVSSVLLFSTNSFAADSEIEQLKQDIDTLKQEINTLKTQKIKYVSVKSDNTSEESNVNNDGAKKSGSIAIGDGALANIDNSISIGKNAGKGSSGDRQIGNIFLGYGAGENSKDSINVYIGYSAGSNASGHNNLAYGNTAGKGIKGDHNIGIGFNSSLSVSGNNNVALGQNSGTNIKGINNTSIGSMANNFNETKAFNYSVALGFQSETTASKATALGPAAKAKQDGALAIGFAAKANAVNSVSIGTGASSKENAVNSVSIGTSSSSNIETSVALGFDSVSNRSIDTIGYDFSEINTKNGSFVGDIKTEIDRVNGEISPLEEKINELQAELSQLEDKKKQLKNENNTTELGVVENKITQNRQEIAEKKKELNKKQVEKNKIRSTWKGTLGAVSIGDTQYGETRQIISVAAGTEDTDAVNVAQLKSLKNAGLTFALNDYDKDQADSTKDKLIKKEIGSIFQIQGKSDLVYNDANKANYTSDNLVTFNDSGVLRIGMLKSPSFTGVTLGEGDKTVSLTADDGVLKAGGKTIFTEDNFKMFFTKLYTFEGGLKTEDKDGKTVVSLNKETIKQMPELKGEKGDKGADGKSAYDAWKAKDGNQGKTEEEFLTSLKGTNGVDGKSAYDLWKAKDGNQGKTEEEFLTAIKGAKGDQGEKGADGKSAYDAWKEIPANEGKTKDEFLASLKGAKGDKGDDGKSAYEVWKAQAGNENKSPQEFADSLKGTNGKDGKSVKATVTDNSDGTHTLEVTNSDNTKTSTKIKDGKNGKSAYEIWRDNGNTGKTEQQFVDSLNANTKLKERVDTIENTVHNHSREIQQNRNAIAQVNRDIQKMNKELRAGIAGAIAIGSLYQNTIPGKETISAGLGSFKGQNAVAVGYSRLSDNGRVGMKANISINSSGDAGAGASIGYTW